jgi:hypothetical protein
MFDNLFILNLNFMKNIYINILTLCQLIIPSNSKQHEARV